MGYMRRGGILLAALAAVGAAFSGSEDIDRLQTELKRVNAVTASLMKRVADEAKRADENARAMTQEQTRLAKAVIERDAAAASLKAVTDEVKATQARQQDFLRYSASARANVEALNATKLELDASNAALKAKKAKLQTQMMQADNLIMLMQGRVANLEHRLAAQGKSITGKKVIQSHAALETETEDNLEQVIVKSQQEQEDDATADQEALKAKVRKEKEAEELRAANKAKVERLSSSLATKAITPETRVGSMASNEQPCCVAHQGPSCIDRKVAKCVCQQRPACCTTNWDAACVETMISKGCGMCSADTLTATPLVGGHVQTGGRTKDQVYFGR